MNELLAGLAMQLRPGSEVYFHVVPMVLLVSIMWGATRHEKWAEILGHAVRFAGMVFVFMGGVLAFLLIASLFPWYVWVSLALCVVVYFRLTRPARAAAK